MRVNPDSPYRMTGRELTLEGRTVADVTLPPLPEYYRHTLANGKTVMETAPTIQWGYLIYLTVLGSASTSAPRSAASATSTTTGASTSARPPYTGVKPVEDVLEALALIDHYDVDRSSKAYTLTGGSVTSTVDGLAEADFYGRYAQAIERLPGRWIGKVVAQALPKAEVQRYKDYGIDLPPELRGLGRAALPLISPGKERYVGRDEWHRRIFDGRGLRRPLRDPQLRRRRRAGEAVRVRDRRGCDRVDDRGTRTLHEPRDHTRFTTWCPEPTTPLGRDNPEGAPLEYHIRLLEAYRETLEKHGLKPPPGYGVAGAGNAVFSVSSFMDTLAPEVVTEEEAVPHEPHSIDEARELWLRRRTRSCARSRRRPAPAFHEPDRATYMVMRIINYTNVCVAQCDYCAFYVLPNQEGGYVLSREDVFAKIDELLEVGGDLVGFNGGFNLRLPLDYYCDLFAAVRERYGDRVEFYALTIAEFVYLADRAKLSYPGGRRAAARRRRPLGHRRRQRI